MLRLAMFLVGVGILGLLAEGLNAQVIGVAGKCKKRQGVCEQVSCDPPCPGFMEPCQCAGDA